MRRVGLIEQPVEVKKPEVKTPAVAEKAENDTPVVKENLTAKKTKK